MPAPVDTCVTQIISGQTCVVCTGQPYVPTIPPHVVTRPVFGWNAGANSALSGGPDQKILDGDLHVADFKVGPCGGFVLGFGPPPRLDVQNPVNLTHAWYLTRINGALVAQRAESGLRVGDPIFGGGSNSMFAIKRVDNQVTYLADLDGNTVYEIELVSDVLSYGPVLVGTAIYATGDTVQ